MLPARFLVGLVLVALLALSPAATAANAVQAGETSDCAAALLSTVAGPLLVPERTTPLSGHVVVEAGTTYVVEAAAGRIVLLFYDADGRLVARHASATSGVVPEGAARGVVCVQRGVPQDDAVAYPPAVWARWSYQDGV